METSEAFPICKLSAACRTCERIPEYSTITVVSSSPEGALPCAVSMAMPSKPIRLAANAPSTRPQIASRSSRKPTLAFSPALLGPGEQVGEKLDLPPRPVSHLGELAPRLRIPFRGQALQDLASAAVKALPRVNLGQRQRRHGRIEHRAPSAVKITGRRRRCPGARPRRR